MVVEMVVGDVHKMLATMLNALSELIKDRLYVLATSISLSVSI